LALTFSKLLIAINYCKSFTTSAFSHEKYLLG